MSERVVIVGYKPLEGKQSELIEFTKTHWDTLNTEGLVSDRKPIIAKAADGTIVEVFGWKSKEAMESAHTNPVVLDMWNRYSQVCEFIPAGKLDELNNLFSEFDPIN